MREHKLNPLKAVEIREQYAAGGVSMRALAAQHDVSPASIKLIVHGIIYADAGGPISTDNRRYAVTRSKLDPDSVRAIRRLYAQGGVSMRQIAIQLNLSPNTISNVVNRRSWRNIE